MSETSEKLSLSLSSAKAQWREFLATSEGRDWFVSNFDMPTPHERGMSTHSPKEFASIYRSAAMEAAAHPELEWKDALTDYLMEHTDMSEWFVQNFFVYALPQSVDSLPLEGAGINIEPPLENPLDPRLLDLTNSINKQALLSVLRDSETIIGDERLIEWVIGVSHSQVLERFASDNDLIEFPIFLKEPGSSLYEAWVYQEQLTDNMDEDGFATLKRMFALLNVSPKDYVDRAMLRKHDMLTDRFIDSIRDTPCDPVKRRVQLTDLDLLLLLDECRGGIPVVFGFANAADLVKVDPRKPVQIEGLNIMFGVHDQINGTCTLRVIRQNKIDSPDGIIGGIDYEDREMPRSVTSVFDGFCQRSRAFEMRNITPSPSAQAQVGDGLDEPESFSPRAAPKGVGAGMATF